MIRFLLNHIPRPVLQRLAGLALPVAGLFYSIGRGKTPDAKAGHTHGVQCPLCGSRYRRFMPYGYVSSRPNALCPGCLSLERHRLLWLWLTRETDLLQTTPRFLHIAPEACLMRKFKKAYSFENDIVVKSGQRQDPRFRQRGADVALTEVSRRGIVHEVQPEPRNEKVRQMHHDHENYITGDLESPLADVKMDVQAIPFPDNSFDVIFCNHVLEHVPDDRLAMREMHRVMRGGGWGVMLSPVEPTRATTFEDDTITDPATRTKLFGQYDHRRIYGRDYADRLRDAGFNVDEIDYFATLSKEEQTLHGLRPETLYIVRKP